MTGRSPASPTRRRTRSLGFAWSRLFLSLSGLVLGGIPPVPHPGAGVAPAAGGAGRPALVDCAAAGVWQARSGGWDHPRSVRESLWTDEKAPADR